MEDVKALEKTSEFQWYLHVLVSVILLLSHYFFIVNTEIYILTTNGFFLDQFEVWYKYFNNRM